MKILYHHRTQAGDAQGIHIKELQEAFREQGHTVFETSPLGEGRGDVRGGILASMARLARGPLYEILELLYNVWGYIQLLRAIRKHQPDFIYERYALFTVAGVLAARKTGIPIILEVNAPLVLEKKRYGKLFFKGLALRFERWICSNADRTLVVTGELKKVLESEGIPSEKMEVMINGVNAQLFNPERSGAGVRSQYGLEGKTVIGFVGWFRTWHRLDLILRVFPKLSGDPNDRHILLVGDGPDRKRLEEITREEGIEKHVTITGGLGREDTANHIAAFDVALEPGVTPYACPMKILEYFAAGKPVVAPKMPNIEELVEEGKNGCLFEKGSIGSFQESLSALLKDDQKRDEMGRNARETILEKGLLWKNNALRVLEIFEEVSKKPGFPG